MKKILFFICTILLIGMVAAAGWPICIDGVKPSIPSNLQVVNNLELTWTASTDTPACSGISYYNIYIDDTLTDTVTTTSYTGTILVDGTYTFAVSAVDKAGNEGTKAIMTVTFPLSASQPSSGGSSGGGGGGGSSGGSGGGSVVTKSSSSSNTTELTDLSTPNNTEEQEETNGNFLTGSAINALDFAKSGYGIVIIIVVLLMAAIIGYSKYKQKKLESKEKIEEKQE